MSFLGGSVARDLISARLLPIGVDFCPSRALDALLDAGCNVTTYVWAFARIPPRIQVTPDGKLVEAPKWTLEVEKKEAG
jgi:hypothetical protein